MTRRSKSDATSARIQSDVPTTADANASPDLALPTAKTAPGAWLVALLLVISIGAVYGHALDTPFIFDDDGAIVKNTSLVSLWPLFGTKQRGPLNPLPDLPTAGRPLVNLSFALNYYFGGLNPIGYHAVNVVIHFISAMLLWAITRRTLLLPYFAQRFESSASWLAFAVAMLWALHPLQTEAVIYATQRTELMMAIFYLATLYFSLRYWTTEVSRKRWLALAVLACLCGMASKEVMVSAPLMVLLFERTFIAGSLAKALRRSWPLYVGLALTLVLLLQLHLSAPHSTTAGFGLGTPAYIWWLTQSKILLMYLKLVVWPSPLLIHYHLPLVDTFAEAALVAVPVALLGIGTLCLLWRNKPAGYLGIWIFAILAPTSVIPIITEMAAERRMYLPLAAIIVLLVVGGYALAEMLIRRFRNTPLPLLSSRLPVAATVVPALLIALVLGLASAQRVTAYYDEMQLWSDVLRYQPQNFWAHFSMGLLLNGAGRWAEATEELKTALAQNPNEAGTLNALGLALTNTGHLPDALDALQQAVALQPKFPRALNNLGFALNESGRFSDAIPPLERALQLQPQLAEAHNNLGLALGNTGKSEQAIAEFQLALELEKDYAKAHNNLGIAFSQIGKSSQAIEQYKLALQLTPNDFKAQFNLAALLAETGETEQAIAQFEQAIRLKPEIAAAHFELANTLRQSGPADKAIEHFQEALRLKPNYWQAYANLAQALAETDRSEEATSTAQKGIELAHSAGEEAVAQPLEAWLTHYQKELERSRPAATPAQPTSPK